jgi:twitching motility two-component system response regulator PilH
MSKILIVDDSSAELASLRTILQELGWNSVTATNGAEAIQKAVSDKPALILMDIVMPDMDGYEACRQLQADPATRSIPVVFVSSKNQKADQMWAKMQGAKTLISKPITSAAIADAIKAYA